MEVLNAYLNSLFAAWPRTVQVLDLKQEMLSAMEDKYEELQQSGKSEHEAIGIVISEFGSVDELMAELGILPDPAGDAVPVVTEEYALQYEEVVRKSAFWNGLGWLLILVGIAAMVMFSAFNENGMFSNTSKESGYLLALVVMFLFLAPAIGMFIKSSTSKQPYSMLNETFELPFNVRTNLEQRMQAFQPTRASSTMTAVRLGTLSPVAIFIVAILWEGEGKTPYGVVAMLVMLGIAMFLFVYAGSIQEGYQKMLRLGDYAPEKKAENHKMLQIAIIVWAPALIIFFISGFVYERWDINWIVFPITAIVFAAIGSLYGMRRKTKQKV